MVSASTISVLGPDKSTLHFFHMLRDDQNFLLFLYVFYLCPSALVQIRRSDNCHHGEFCFFWAVAGYCREIPDCLHLTSQKTELISVNFSKSLGPLSIVIIPSRWVCGFSKIHWLYALHYHLEVQRKEQLWLIVEKCGALLVSTKIWLLPATCLITLIDFDSFRVT